MGDSEKKHGSESKVRKHIKRGQTSKIPFSGLGFSAKKLVCSIIVGRGHRGPRSGRESVHLVLSILRTHHQQ